MGKMHFPRCYLWGSLMGKEGTGRDPGLTGMPCGDGESILHLGRSPRNPCSSRPFVDQSLLNCKFSHFLRDCNIVGLNWEQSLA